MKTYHHFVTPNVLPTQSLRLPSGGLYQAVPSDRDLALACQDNHHRLVGAYEMVCAHTALLRQHLASLLPDNWREHDDWTEVVTLLGGQEFVDRFAAATTDDEQIGVCKLP